MTSKKRTFLTRFIGLGTVIWLAGICLPAFATTKGLNQIVTPDIQPLGVLSISAQGENSALGNSKQLQFELGLSKWFEVALFKGFDPSDSVVGAEIGLVQKKSFLLSTGVLGVQNKAKSQPFIEGGYYSGKGFVIGGIQEQDGSLVGVYGAAYQATARILVSSDYVSGPGNFATAGLTFTLTPNLTFNPALYLTNSRPMRAFGYGVLSWNVKLW